MACTPPRAARAARGGGMADAPAPARRPGPPWTLFAAPRPRTNGKNTMPRRRRGPCPATTVSILDCVPAHGLLTRQRRSERLLQKAAECRHRGGLRGGVANVDI